MLIRRPHAFAALPACVLFASALLSSCSGTRPYGRDRARADRGELGIVDTALVVAQCGRFAGAVQSAGLADWFDTEEQITVFVPVDEAWMLLDVELQRRLREDKAYARRLLLGHVFAGTLTAPRLIESPQIETVNGSKLPVTIAGDQVQVGGAGVVTGDVRARNGVLHFVDHVILPEGATGTGR